MKDIFIKGIVAFFISMLILDFSECAYAYIGPGAGLGMIGSVIAIVIAVLVVLVGLIIYPIRWVIRRRARAKNN
jgi:hypothetical protein